MPKSDLPPDLTLTPIPASVDLKEMDLSIRKIADAVNKSSRHTERIPGIEKKVEVTGTKVVELGVKFEHIGDRVDKVEHKIDRGHDCVQVEIISDLKTAQREASQKIEIDAIEGVEHKTKLEMLSQISNTLEAEISDFRKTPRRLFYGLAGTLLTILLSVGGAVWYLAELGKDIEYERKMRAEQFTRIEGELKGIQTVRVDTSAMKEGMVQLEKVMHVKSEKLDMYNELCADMEYRERRALRILLVRRNKRVPLSCME